ncbi:MAG: hypothetical protein JWL77_4218 [Chthonomonadaceae bacterium]|nr:hypothetical protein [Chthonomonadaceae bacterium]
MNILRLLQEVDRRVLYVLLLLAVTVPFFVKFRLPVAVSPPTQALYDAIDNLPENSFVLFGPDYSGGTRGENGAQTEALLRHLMIMWHKKKVRFGILAFDPQGKTLAQNIALGLQEEYNKQGYDIKEGVNWVNFGYRVDQQNFVRAMVKDVPGTLAKDIHDAPLGTLPVMKGIQTAKDISMILDVNPTINYTIYIQFMQGPYKIPMGLAPTAVMAPEAFNYLDSGQIVGMLQGLQGAVEYEQLLNTFGRATRASNSLSVAHLLLIGFIILGNIAMLLERSKQRRAGGAV